jgi:hypothetical protein
MKAKLTIAAILFFSIIISCNKAAKNKNFEIQSIEITEVKKSPFQETGNKKEPKIPLGTLQQATTDSGTSQPPVKAVSNPDWDKKIIKTATLKLEVKDFKSYNDNVHKTVKQFGSYIA